MRVEVQVSDHRWRRDGHELLHIDDLRLEGPGIVLLLGGNGSGKSSLLRAITGALDEAYAGTVQGRVIHRIDGEERSPRIGFVAQDALDGLLGFDPTSEVQLRLQLAGWKRADAAREAAARLARLRYEGKEHVAASDLSAGERRRLALHAALVADPHLLVLDEPLSHLDDQWAPLIFEEILAAAEKSLVVAAVHEPGDWAQAARSIVLLRAGRVHWQGTSEEFAAVRAQFPELRHPPQDPFLPPPNYGGPEILAAHGVGANRGRPLFRDASLRLGPGVHALVGPNGSGKSTLLRLLAGLEPPVEGRVLHRGRDAALASGRERAAFAAVHLEEPGRLFFLPTALEEISFQPLNAGLSDFETEAAARVAASRFRLEPFLRRHPLSLSGGEQERVAMACVEAVGARLFLLDEPTNGLDGPGWRDLLAFLDRHRRQDCIVLATHEPTLVRLADSVHRVEDGRVVPVRLGNHSPLVEVRARTPS